MDKKEIFNVLKLNSDPLTNYVRKIQKIVKISSLKVIHLQSN